MAFEGSDGVTILVEGIGESIVIRSGCVGFGSESWLMIDSICALFLVVAGGSLNKLGGLEETGPGLRLGPGTSAFCWKTSAMETASAWATGTVDVHLGGVPFR
jgi:hypothetical protein